MRNRQREEARDPGPGQGRGPGGGVARPPREAPVPRPLHPGRQSGQEAQRACDGQPPQERQHERPGR
eukprot:7924473-Alexandrium_andersonii.AAC.1